MIIKGYGGISVSPTHCFLIIGLPGSGKTHYANTSLKDVPLVDDIVSINQLSQVTQIAITDVNFCDATVLEKAETILADYYGHAIFYHIYFENDARKARMNVLRRNDERNVEGTIARFEKIYNPPADALKIWSEE